MFLEWLLYARHWRQSKEQGRGAYSSQEIYTMWEKWTKSSKTMYELASFRY